MAIYIVVVQYKNPIDGNTELCFFNDGKTHTESETEAASVQLELTELHGYVATYTMMKLKD